MAHFILSIETDNAAFDPNAAPEVARILQKIAGHIGRSGDIPEKPIGIFDINGNKVGSYRHNPR